MTTHKYVIGLDYGTDSVRALLVDTANGEEIATAVHPYARWKQGKYCDSKISQFRQHPLDYIEGMQAVIMQLVSETPKEIIAQVKAIAIDTTGSTPVAVDENGTPLALLPDFEDNPNAMFVLWKDHTANQEADEINALAKKWSIDFTKYSGGIYSSEWFWSKITHIVRNDDQVAQKAFSWMEHCDWMPALLTGNTDPLTIKRSRCAAGHKAMWHEDFDGLPSEEYLVTLEPRLAGLRSRLYTETHTSDESMGKISDEWASKLGLPTDVLVGVGALDAHFGAIGAGITVNTLVKVMGTSTCDMVVADLDEYKSKLINGICGQVDGSILPGMLGMEAGQSAFGDLYHWFKQFLLSPLYSLGKDILSESELEDISDKMLPFLNREATQLQLTEDDVVALDWINGKRTPDVDMNLKCVISDITLGTKPAHIFKALVEATAFGSKAIVERFKEEGVVINEVLALGGITRKSDFVMQTLANVLNTKIKVVTSEQACALGASMFAAAVAGIYENVGKAQEKMTSGFDKVYSPQTAKVKIYEVLYRKYLKLGLI